MGTELPDIARIAIWLPEAGCMATQISPDKAVTVASALPEDAPGTRATFFADFEADVTILVRDKARDLALLQTPPREMSSAFLSPGIDAYTYFVADGPRLVPAFVSGTLVSFQPIEGMQRAALGAPVVYDGKFVGMISGYAGEGSWHYIHALELAESTFRRPTLSLSDLTPGAVRALSYAAGAAEDEPVMIDHLYYGLNENYAGTTRRLLRAKGVSAPSFTAEPVKLTELPAVDDLVARALDTAMQLADRRGERHIRGRHLLYGALSVMPLGNLTPADVQLDDHRAVLGHRADTVDGEDLLDIKREARVLAGVLGASTVEPPISLGLFGEWGSGKSFFMHEMERQFREIEGKPGYCHNIVQIWFNAWHYIDTPNLWASLAAEIFERLDFELDVRQGKRERDETAQQRAGALARSAKVRSELADITAERTQIESELEEVESNLAGLQDEREIAKSIGLRRVFTAAVDAAGTGQPARDEMNEIRQRIDAARKKLNLTERSVAELREATTRGRAMALAAAKIPLLSWLLVILFALLVLFGAAIADRVNDAVRALIAVIGVLASPLVALFTPGGKAAAALYQAWAIKDRLIDEQRKELARPLIEDQDRLTKQLEEKKEQEKTKVEELERSEKTVADLEPRRQMSNFVAERTRSADYSRHLGVIARAHDDFAELSRLLRRATAQPAGDGVPPVDRIVLYIDDLDRCPEDKVVDVLQAVHLLLAFPLFIVVVGVDSRWLLHSLQRHLRQFSAQDADQLSQTLWASTPLNYLEKIFQIPFTIRRMKPGAFGDLIENLTRPQDDFARERGLMKAPQPVRVKVVESADAMKGTSFFAPAVLKVLAQQRLDKATPAQEKKAEPPIDYLALESWETADMKAMYPLIPSPRAAKRFVNTYRLMRGMIDEYERKAFIGDGAALAGEYRAALLMLAMLTGYPEETTAILQELVNDDAPLPPDFWTFLGPKIVRDDVREALDAIRSKLPVMPPAEVFKRRAPDVARFSFHSGRIVAAQV